MKRIAIVGGGISGLTAAYEFERARLAGAAIDWQLYEASDRLGGIIETTRHETPEGTFILEGGPDGWVSEKPWARELAIELGLEDHLIHSNDATRKTYILLDGQLQSIPDGMRLMVPTDLAALNNSPLFSPEAKRAYAAELTRAEELKAAAPTHDESIADFVRRHFGDEVLTTLAAPLLSGVFGGDVHKLSVRAVMPLFVAMECEHGSLIAALQAKAAAHGAKPQRPIFTSLRGGMSSLVEALVSQLPAGRLHLNSAVTQIAETLQGFEVSYGKRTLGFTKCQFAQHVIISTPLDASRIFLTEHIERDDLTRQLPTEASSAILVALAWPAEAASTFTVPSGFGFLVPQTEDTNQLLACTFIDQKFPHRVPEGARILRAFFGGPSADFLAHQTNEAIATAALKQLKKILGPLPQPAYTQVRRLPRSLPQYEVGHLDRMAQFDVLVARIGNLTLLGNSYRGVGLPDLIRDARSAARTLVDQIATAPIR
jgi:protoporphyrinogen/coproporphyrinogen III oxidase